MLSVSTVLISLQSLLGEPNNASPLNVEAAELWEDKPKVGPRRGIGVGRVSRVRLADDWIRLQFAKELAKHYKALPDDDDDDDDE